MRLSRIAVIFCSCILISFSVIVSKFLFFMNTLDDTVSLFDKKNTSGKYQFVGGGELKNVQWMIQISDLHISLFHDPTRISELAQFCNDTIRIIKPSVVLATGDLTDSKTPDGEGSTQYEEEWKIYRDILHNNNIPNKTLWLDIRGNHDNFDVLNVNSHNNYFRKYSIQGQQHPRSYFYVNQMPNGEKIGYIGVDACLLVGVRRPFNFVGQLSRQEMQSIGSFLQQSRELNVDYLFWFGHYPTSTIQFPQSDELRELIARDERSTGYFCGHLHQIGGLVPQMYTHQREGFFELELADWRGNRIFRIMAIDHGQFTFRDLKHGTWPVILVTNPISAVLVPPVKTHHVPNSSHIRLLVFSGFPITKVELKIDQGEWKRCSHVGGPLYVVEWNPREYNKGLHVMTVVAEDGQNSDRIEHYFSLDGTRLKTKFLPRLFLMPNLGMLFYFLFTCTVLFCAVPLLVFRYLVRNRRVDAEQISTIKWNFIVRWCRRFCIMSHLDQFFYPLMIYPLYLFAGPWAIVYLVGNKLGVVFAWGIIIDNIFEPSWITYPFGWKQMVLHAFLILHLARQIDRRCFKALLKEENFNDQNALMKYLSSIWDNLFYVIVIFLQFSETYNFWLSYGNLTLAFCPLTSWWIVMALWLKKQATCLDKDMIIYLARQWRPTL